MRYNPEKLSRHMVNASVQTEIFSWLKAGGRMSYFNRSFEEPNVSRNSYQYMWRFPSFFETYGYRKDDAGTVHYFRNERGTPAGPKMEEKRGTQPRPRGRLTAQITKGPPLQAAST